MQIGQAAPQLPGANILTAFDSINQSLYTALATDPIIGALAKALPPPPKVSALFTGQNRPLNIPGLPAFLQLPGLPQPPAATGAKQTVTSSGRTVKSPFA
jgi:hypothetical protein